MDYVNAFIEFFKTFFAALTAFLGRSIPFVSDLAGLDLTAEGTTAAAADEG